MTFPRRHSRNNNNIPSKSLGSFQKSEKTLEKPPGFTPRFSLHFVRRYWHYSFTFSGIFCLTPRRMNIIFLQYSLTMPGMHACLRGAHSSRFSSHFLKNMDFEVLASTYLPESKYGPTFLIWGFWKPWEAFVEVCSLRFCNPKGQEGQAGQAGSPGVFR